MKIVIVFFTLVMLASCSPFGFNMEGYEVLSEPLEVAWPKAAALKYVPDTSPDDYWKSPHETLEDGGGDCEDIAAFLVYLLGVDAYLVEITISDNRHCIVEYRNYYIEPQIEGLFYTSDQFSVHNKIAYEELMVTITRGGFE